MIELHLVGSETVAGKTSEFKRFDETNLDN